MPHPASTFTSKPPAKLTAVPQQTGASLVELLAKVAMHDRAAFALLYQATSLKLFGVILRILKRRQISEDLLQDTFIKIWDKADAFDPARGSAIAWMAAIARNHALDEARRRPNLLSSADVIGFENIAAPERSVLDQWVADEDLARLGGCLNGLDPDKRHMLLLAYHDGLSREMLAERFDRPVATIKTWLRRSLRSLKECLGR